jgi:mevalonate pyrophosphate decarboxylase
MDEQTQNLEITFKPRHQAFACAYASGACGAAAHGSALVTGHEACLDSLELEGNVMLGGE